MEEAVALARFPGGFFNFRLESLLLLAVGIKRRHCSKLTRTLAVPLLYKIKTIFLQEKLYPESEALVSIHALLMKKKTMLYLKPRK